MRIYNSSRAKRKRLYRKSEFQKIWLICGGHVGVLKLSTNMASPYKALKYARNVLANNLETAHHRDLRLGKVFTV